MIPINQSFLYVEPLYLIAKETNIPQLRRVIVAHADLVAMEPTLEQALQRGDWTAFGNQMATLKELCGE